MPESRIPVEIALYEEGRLAVAVFIHTLDVDTTPSGYRSYFLPDARNTAWGYRLDVEPVDVDAGGWITLRLTLFGVDGTRLGPATVPALLWQRPWSVPMVCSIPPVYPDQPRHTVTMRVVEPVREAFAAAGRDTDE